MLLVRLDKTQLWVHQVCVWVGERNKPMDGRLASVQGQLWWEEVPQRPPGYSGPSSGWWWSNYNRPPATAKRNVHPERSQEGISAFRLARVNPSSKQRQKKKCYFSRNRSSESSRWRGWSRKEEGREEHSPSPLPPHSRPLSPAGRCALGPRSRWCCTCRQAAAQWYTFIARPRAVTGSNSALGGG